MRKMPEKKFDGIFVLEAGNPRKNISLNVLGGCYACFEVLKGKNTFLCSDRRTACVRPILL